MKSGIYPVYEERPGDSDCEKNVENLWEKHDSSLNLKELKEREGSTYYLFHEKKNLMRDSQLWESRSLWPIQAPYECKDTWSTML